MVWGTVGSWANSTAENTIAAADCSTVPRQWSLLAVDGWPWTPAATR